MKKGGEILVATVRHCKSSCYFENRCRHLSSLRSTGDKHRRPFVPVIPTEIFMVHHSEWWDGSSKTHPHDPELTTGNPLWFDSQHAIPNARSEPAVGVDSLRGRASNQLVFDWEAERHDAARTVPYEDIVKAGTLKKLCKEGNLGEVVEALTILINRGCYVDGSLFYRILKRCRAEKNLSLGRRVHALAVRSGYEANVFLANHFIRMYASHGRLQEALQVFSKVAAPDAYMWAAIILAHAEHGQPTSAIDLYRQMRQSTVKPDNHIFVAVLKACVLTADLSLGKEVHADILRSKVDPNMFVGSCLVDMYAKCGSLEDARRVFDALPARDVVIWTAMIAGYAQQAMGYEGLTLYKTMLREGVTPNSCTFVCLLKACASVGALREGKEFHLQIQGQGLEGNILVGNSLVDMYAKCGSLDDARRVFDRLPKRDVVTWTALLNGYAEHSDGKMAMECFDEMQRQGVEPNDTTFACLLVACSHGGLVEEGQQYFRMMVEDHGIAPTCCHYNCVVDLLGRAGHLQDAENMLLSMPFEKNVVGWRSLLSACKSHGDVELGRRCFDRLVVLEPGSAAPYVLLGNIYANACRWSDVEDIESLRRSAGASKKAAKACIEVKTKVHEFTVGEERADVSSKLKSLNLRLEGGGHVPQTELVLRPVSDLEKQDALCGHAEKLALAYGLLNTPDGATLLVTKNLRMCSDCHSSTKIMSRLENREIIVRDAHRVHHFLDGSCSCGDRH